MKTNKKNNDTKKLIMGIVAVVMIILIASGGTYAWWTWSSNTAAGSNERTNATFTVASPTFTITGKNAAGNKLAPITGCYNSAYTLTGNATAVAKNNSSNAMTATIKLKATLTPVSGRTLTDTQKSHIHWAVRQTDSSDTTYTAAKCGESNSTTFSTGVFTGYSNGNDINTTITFPVATGATVNKYYQLYVWIDSNYQYKNVGSNAVTDPMQGLTVNLTFSSSSKLTQNQ